MARITRNENIVSSITAKTPLLVIANCLKRLFL